MTWALLLLLAMDYATYLGGSGPDVASGVAVDYAGGLYVAGTSSSINFPVTSTTLGGPAPNHHCGFVTKFTPDGSGLDFSVCIPDLIINAFAMDPSGAMYLAVTNLDYSQSLGKLDRNARTIVYTISLGGGQERGLITGITADPYGVVYVAGYGTSLITTYGAYQQQPTPGICYTGAGVGMTPITCSDVYVAKISRSGSLVYGTYLGGSNEDRASAIAIDSFGNAWITGTTISPDYPTTMFALQNRFHGEISVDVEHFGDAFVTELDPTGSTLLYSSYLGGTEADFGSAIPVDPTGAVYISGFTQSPDFPVTPGAMQPMFTGDPKALPGGHGNGFAVKFDPGGKLIYSTYLPTPAVTSMVLNRELQMCVTAYQLIAGNGNGLVYQVFKAVPGLPTSPGAFQATYGGGDSDVFAQASAASLCFQAAAK